MAASGYTPIVLFNSGTTTNTPTTSNLVVGELAINYADIKLFYNNGSAINSWTFPAGSPAIGYLNIPQNSQSAAYTTVLTDAGKTIFHPASDANARTFTIAANSSVAYPIGTVIQFINMTSQVVTIAINTDTLTWAQGGGTGSRSLAQYGVANCVKIATTQWLLTGTNVT
jgi:hypothetical protein